MKLKHALMLLALGAAALLSGCYSKSTVIKAAKLGVETGYMKATRECIDIQSNLGLKIMDLQLDLEKKNDRLRSFNQLNPDGSLRVAPKEIKSK